MNDSGVRRRFEKFWVLQTLGWSVYTGGTVLDVLTVTPDRYASAMASEIAFLIVAFLSTFVLRAVCRRSLARGIGWPTTMLRAVLASALCAIPCAVAMRVTGFYVRSAPMSLFVLLNSLVGASLYGTVVLTSWCGLYLGIKHYQLFEAEQERARQAEALARSARLQALSAQLQPHFLFNTLNAISTLIVEGQATAANRMLGQLAGFLRVTLDESCAPQITLAREVANTRQYLAIEHARLGDRLALDIAIAPDVERALVPALLLQPLAENAVQHGIMSRPAGGTLTIHAQRADTRVRIRIADNGAGRSPIGSPGAQLERLRGRRGMGLANTVERLRVLYGNDQRVAIRWPDEGGCEIDIDLPYSTGQAARSMEGDPACAS